MLGKSYQALSSLILIVTLTACNLQGSYQPPLIPLKVVISSTGEITLEASAEFITPLGIFEIGVASNPYSFFDTVQNTLIIRTATYDCVYDLNGNNFEIQFEPGLEARTLRKDSQSNIFLELGGNYTGCQQSLPQMYSIAPRANDCAVPYEPSLTRGQRVHVAVFQVNVRTGPAANYDLVRNKYLKEGRTVTLLEGPVCGQTISGGNSWWWKLKSDEITLADGQRVIIVGWVGEKDDDTFLLAP